MYQQRQCKSSIFQWTNIDRPLNVVSICNVNKSIEAVKWNRYERQECGLRTADVAHSFDIHIKPIEYNENMNNIANIFLFATKTNMPSREREREENNNGLRLHSQRMIFIFHFSIWWLCSREHDRVSIFIRSFKKEKQLVNSRENEHVLDRNVNTFGVWVDPISMKLFMKTPNECLLSDTSPDQMIKKSKRRSLLSK